MQLLVVEDQVYIVMRIIQRDALLRSYEHETSAKFQHEIFNLSDKCLFKIAFQNRLVLRNTKKLKDIGILYDILRNRQFLAFSCEFVDLLPIRLTIREQ